MTSSFVSPSPVTSMLFSKVFETVPANVTIEGKMYYSEITRVYSNEAVLCEIGNSLSIKIERSKEQKCTFYFSAHINTQSFCADDIFFEDELISKRDKDLRFTQTSVGPHRDDISFKINDIDMRKFGSQGQQRCCALSLKLSEIDIVKNIIKENPVLLLDDVLSELDSNRQKFLLNGLSDIQTIITCTGLDDFVNNRFDADKIFKVVNGVIENG